MDWRAIRRDLAVQAMWALVLSALFARFAAVPFALSAAVLLFAWPVTDLILEAIRARNPWNAEAVYGRERSWRPLLRTAGIVLVPALVVSLWQETRFVPTLAWTTLLLTTVGALLSIAFEWEDNRRGGWENPRPLDGQPPRPAEPPAPHDGQD